MWLLRRSPGRTDRYTAGKSVVVGGTTYKFNKAASIDTSALAGAIDNDVTLALDKYGYVLNVNTDATSTNYAVVLKYQDKGSFDDAKAELLFTDGTTKTVELKDNADVETGSLVSYTITNKGKYDLKVLEKTPDTETGVTLTTKGSSTIRIGSVVKANGKTIFLVATKSGNSDTGVHQLHRHCERAHHHGRQHCCEGQRLCEERLRRHRGVH